MLNIAIILATGLIPLAVGIIWYNNSFGFGKAWMAEIGMTEADLQKNFNPLKIFGFTYLFGVFLAIGLMPMVLHQMGLSSMLQGTDYLNPNSEVGKSFAFLMENYGTNFRTFKHGALHGILGAVCIGFPILAISGLFERRSWKYLFIHLGYWIITMGLMGGVVSTFLTI
jgi:hypothetical protein